MEHCIFCCRRLRSKANHGSEQAAESELVFPILENINYKICTWNFLLQIFPSNVQSQYRSPPNLGLLYHTLVT